MRKLKKCRKGEWMLVVGGAKSVRGIRGCYATKAAARRARKRLVTKVHAQGSMLYSTFWVIQK